MFELFIERPRWRGKGSPKYIAIGWHRWRPFYVCPSTRILRAIAIPRERRSARDPSA